MAPFAATLPTWKEWRSSSSTCPGRSGNAPVVVTVARLFAFFANTFTGVSCVSAERLPALPAVNDASAVALPLLAAAGDEPCRALTYWINRLSRESLSGFCDCRNSTVFSVRAVTVGVP